MSETFRCIALRLNDALMCLKCDHPNGAECPVNVFIRDGGSKFTATGRPSKQGQKKSIKAKVTA